MAPQSEALPTERRGAGVDGGMTAATTAATVVVAAVLVGFVVGGVAAYRGSWAPLRRSMLRDPEGHVHAGALWLGLLGVPITVLVLTDPPAGGGLTPVHWAALILIAMLMVPTVALAFNRPAALTRWFTPKWLLDERERRCGPLRPDGRSVDRSV